MEAQKTVNSQGNLEKGRKKLKHHAPWFQTILQNLYCKTTVIKTVWHQGEDQGGRVGGRWAHLPRNERIKNTSTMWSNSHWQQTGNWQKDSYTTKGVKKNPHGIWVGREAIRSGPVPLGGDKEERDYTILLGFQDAGTIWVASPEGPHGNWFPATDTLTIHYQEELLLILWCNTCRLLKNQYLLTTREKMELILNIWLHDLFSHFLYCQ